MYIYKRKLAALLLFSAIPFGVADATEAPYPQRPISLVVGFPPGGPSDGLARMVAEFMSAELKQRVVVENRAGAASNVAAAWVARSAPADGYTMYLSSRTNAIHQVLPDKTDYDVYADFAPVGMVATSTMVLVVGNHVPAKTMSEFIAYAKDKPGKVTCASAGVGSTSHLLCELFQSKTGTQMLHVPYRGAGPALTDMLSGQVDVKFDNLPSSLAHLRRGDLRALGVMAENRSHLAPDVPTLAEAGLPEFALDSWFGLLVPAATPAPVIARLNSAVNRIMADQNAQQAFDRQGYAVARQPNPPEALMQVISEDIDRWRALVTSRNIRPM